MRIFVYFDPGLRMKFMGVIEINYALGLTLFGTSKLRFRSSQLALLFALKAFIILFVIFCKCRIIFIRFFDRKLRKTWHLTGLKWHITRNWLSSLIISPWLGLKRWSAWSWLWIEFIGFLDLYVFGCFRFWLLWRVKRIFSVPGKYFMWSFSRNNFDAHAVITHRLVVYGFGGGDLRFKEVIEAVCIGTPMLTHIWDLRFPKNTLIFNLLPEIDPTFLEVLQLVNRRNVRFP